MAPNAFHIVVDTLDGNELVFELEPEASVFELKLQIEAKSGTPPDRQRLVRKSTILAAEDIIQECVKDGDHLLMIVTPPNHFIFAGYDRCARLWVAETCECLVTFKGHQDRIRSASASPDGLMVMTSSDDGSARIWNTKTGECLQTLDGHAGPVTCASFSPDSKRVITASDDGVSSNCRMWWAETGCPVMEQKVVRKVGRRIWEEEACSDSTFMWLASHGACARSIAWDFNGSQILVAAGEEACLWTAAVPATRMGIFEGHADVIATACFSFDGSLVLTASHDQTARLWDVAAGVCTLELVGHGEPLECATFSPDNEQILTAGGSRCILWTVGGVRLRDFYGQGATMNSCAFSSDGAVAVTASSDGRVRLWDVNEGDCVQDFTTERPRPAICASFCA